MTAVAVEDTERIGDWIQTFSGKKFYILDPRPEDFDINDVAHSLSHQCRYAGHTRRYYSIAEHSILLCDYIREHTDHADYTAYMALMHDGAEAYYLDIPRPIKNNMPGLKKAMEPVDKMFAQVFGLVYPTLEDIEKLDKRIVVDEKRHLMRPNRCLTPEELVAVNGVGPHWHSYNNLKPLNVEIKCWSPGVAKNEFFKRWRELKDAAVS